MAILGRNGCGKTTLFKILTGEMDYDGGEVYVNPNKRLGLISQIPHFPAGYTVEDVLRSAFSEALSVGGEAGGSGKGHGAGATKEQLARYDAPTNRFQAEGGYTMDVDIEKSATAWPSPLPSGSRNSTAFPAAKRPG